MDTPRHKISNGVNEDQDKTIKRLVEAIHLSYNSPGRLFWRGLLWGLGRGIGNLIGWLLLLVVLVYLVQITGLDEIFKNLVQTLKDISNSVNSFRQ